MAKNNNMIVKGALNYQLVLDKTIENVLQKGIVPTLLLHSCCGPCSSYVLEYLSKYFAITVFYYNPNIYPSDEYYFRIEEQQRIIDLTDAKYPIKLITGEYETKRFYDITRGLEKEKEGGKRCFKCYKQRLEEAAKIAQEEGFDYFTTTLSISPHKDSKVLNNIGIFLAQKYNVNYLLSDFKKNGGYQRSCVISKEHGMYRQDYCGCVFSKVELENILKEKEKREKLLEQIAKEKQEKRIQAKNILKSLDKEYMQKADRIICEKILQTKEYINAKNIFVFLPKEGEIDIYPLIKQAFEDGKVVLVPYTPKDQKNMTAYVLDSFEDIQNLQIDSFGIRVPKVENKKPFQKDKIDLVIAPNLAASKDGTRLGYGKGYYDAFLKRFTKNVIMPVREKQIIENLPKSDYDVIIPFVLTEN